jgi:O-acetyl-ADP-ribose deacetylase (regulator of RNase III)
MNVEVVEGDLLDQQVEVIVNAWNRNVIPWWLLIPQGVSGAIKRRGGVGPFRELARPRRRHQPALARNRAVDSWIGSQCDRHRARARLRLGGDSHHRER